MTIAAKRANGFTVNVILSDLRQHFVIEQKNLEDALTAAILSYISQAYPEVILSDGQSCEICDIMLGEILQ